MDRIRVAEWVENITPLTNFKEQHANILDPPVTK